MGSSVTTSVKNQAQSCPNVINPAGQVRGNQCSGSEKIASSLRASDPVSQQQQQSESVSPVKPASPKKKSSVSALIARFEETNSTVEIEKPAKVPLRSTRSVTPDKILSDLGDDVPVARPKSAVDPTISEQNEELPLGAEAIENPDVNEAHDILEEDIDIDEMTRRNGAYTSYVLIGASASHNDLETASIHSSGSSGRGNRVVVNVNKGVVLQDGRASNISIVSTESSDLGSPPAEGVDPSSSLFEPVPDIPAKIRARNGAGVLDPSLGPDMQYFVSREPGRQNDYGQRSRGGGDPDDYLDDPSLTNYYTNALESSVPRALGSGSRGGRPPVIRAADRMRRQQMFHEEIGEGEIMVEYDEYHPDQVEGHPENFHITEVGPSGEHYEVYTDEMIDCDDDYDVRYESEEHSGDEEYVDNQDYPMCQPVQYDSEEYISEGDDYFDREEELRGYNRQIDFTLHTILEESCEDSDALSERARSGMGQAGSLDQQKRSNKRHSDPSEMEKYFLYGVGGEMDEEDYNHSSGSCSPDEVIEDDLAPHDQQHHQLEHHHDLDQQQPQSLIMLSDQQNTDDSGSVGSESDGQRTPDPKNKKKSKSKSKGG